MTEAEALHWHLAHPGQPMPPDVAELLEWLFAAAEDARSPQARQADCDDQEDQQ